MMRMHTGYEKDVKKGALEVICGSMFSGKTEDLMRRLKRAEYAKQNVVTLKHRIDNRKSSACIVSHDGQERIAFAIDQSDAMIDQILSVARQPEVDVVGIDEVQFFPTEIVDVIAALIDCGKRVIVAGLDLDFRGEPFGVISNLLAIADLVTKLKAICMVCGKDAQHTQRIVNGRPASYHDPIILVGSTEYYEARCRDCFVIDRPAPLSFMHKQHSL